MSRPIALAAALLAATLTAANAAETVTITTKSDAKAAAISPLLTGSQFNFFATPIKQRMTSPTLLDTWRSANIKVLRYPGGTWGDHYVWDHPDHSYFAVPTANASSIITPAQFVTVCRSVGAEPIFQINMNCKGGSNENRVNPTNLDDIRAGAKWAAEWVRDANIKNGWRVKYWELGNEVWIWLQPAEYARAVAEYSAAMRAVDPSIKIIACGLSGKVGPFGVTWLNFPDDPTWKPRTANVNEPAPWTNALLALPAGTFDYLAPHPYISFGKEDVPRDTYLGTMKKVWDDAPMKGQDDLLKAAHSNVRLAATEWVCNFGSSVSARGGITPHMYFYTLGNGLNVAHYLAQMVADDRVDIAVMHSLDEIQTLYYWPKKELAQKPLDHGPMLALSLWGQHLGTRHVPTAVTGAPTVAIDGKAYPAVSITASEDAGHVYLMAINLDPDSAHKFTWRHQDSSVNPAAALSTVTGPALDSDNWASWGKPDALLQIVTHPLAITNGDITFDLPAHSMAGVTLTKKPTVK
ncbi:MAG TPA: hypothetical protein VGK19_12790 [Capsulimonadaceae bacterium]|jgi:alpha-L-arabinofuranosidase